MVDLKRLACISVVTGAFALGMSPAHADPMELRLSDSSGNSLIIIDNLYFTGTGVDFLDYAADQDTAPGTVSYSLGSLGDWSFGTLVGVESSAGSQATLSLSVVATDGGLAVPTGLDIDLISSLLTSPSSLIASGLTTVTGTVGTDGGASFESLFSAGPGALFLGPYAGGFADAATFGPLDTTSGFTLDNLASIEHTGETGTTTSFDMVTTVTIPEPTSLGLLGLGLLGLGFMRRRKAA